jgi:hypothetical protein
MFTGGDAVISKFDETLFLVVLLIILPGKVLFDDKFDDIVVLFVGDRVIKVVFDELLLFNNSFPIELMIGNRVLTKTFITVVFVK